MTLPIIEPLSGSGPLRDTFGRVHSNLRISVTDRCNLRCTYCMSEDVEFLDKHELLTFEEITRFVEIAAPLGINKVRLTGGEPLLRRDLPRLVAMLSTIPGIKDIGLTTNGILLSSLAQPLFDAGLQRLNISLDALSPERFRAISRRDGLEKVLDGILAAQKAGFQPIKINAVVIRGVNDGEIVPLAQFARRHGLEMRYIEYMPIGADSWEREKVLPAIEILDLIERSIGPVRPAADYDPKAPAMDFEYLDGGGRLGIIASVSRPFCHSCNRIRLTAEGKLRNCLFALNEVDVKPYLRQGANPDVIAQLVKENVWEKWEGHEINAKSFVKPQRTMHAIGG